MDSLADGLTQRTDKGNLREMIFLGSFRYNHSLVMLLGGSVAETSGGLVKGSMQWTPEQHEWLQTESRRLGLASVSAVARMIVQAAMTAAQETCLKCPKHCSAHEGVQQP